MTAEVCIVHCIDTEGPLYESLEAKFERLRHLFGITDLSRTRQTLDALIAGEINLGGIEAQVQKVLSGHLQNYMSTWTEVDRMLLILT